MILRCPPGLCGNDRARGCRARDLSVPRRSVPCVPRTATADRVDRDQLLAFLRGVIVSTYADGPWVQVDGEAEVLDLPEALEPLVDHYRAISGEHPDWTGYRAAMTRPGKSLLQITVTGWGPVATGGFPPEIIGKL